VTQCWYATLLHHPMMYHHTKFGDPTSNNIEDMLWTKKSGQTDRQSDIQMDGDGANVQMLTE